jgi:hypothetical protein
MQTLISEHKIRQNTTPTSRGDNNVFANAIQKGTPDLRNYDYQRIPRCEVLHICIYLQEIVIKSSQELKFVKDSVWEL